MVTLEVGRVCIKTAGREAGKYCAVIKKDDENFVVVTGPKALTGVKRRRCNVEHLEPTQYLIKIKDDAPEKEVMDAFEKAGVLAKLTLKKPSPEVLKESEKVIEKKVVEKPKVEEKKEVKEKTVEKPKEEKTEKPVAPKKVEEPKPKRGVRGKEEKMSEKVTKAKKTKK
ncbi:MAG: 50S ribosomal protein L14e [Candidatus Aenigmarchaeota archaeon]|nr:50S ribosomal protein L14e [Candidatus Aenigmarchaeota archaeon]